MATVATACLRLAVPQQLRPKPRLRNSLRSGVTLQMQAHHWLAAGGRSAIRCRGQMGGAWRESEGAGPEGLRGPVSGSQAKELKGPGRKPLGVSSFLLSSEKGGMRTSKKVPLGLSRRYEPLWERNTTTGSVRARMPAPAVLPRPTPPPALWLGSTARRDGR